MSPITKNTIVTKEQASFLDVGGFDACTGYNIRSKVLENMKFRKMSNVWSVEAVRDDPQIMRFYLIIYKQTSALPKLPLSLAIIC